MNKKDLYKIDKDISIARTLDSSFYIDKNLFKTLVTDIFSSTWQYGLHLNQIRNKNIYPINFLPETLSESITFTREDEKINCISNVCTHRAHLIVLDNLKSIQKGLTAFIKKSLKNGKLK